MTKDFVDEDKHVERFTSILYRFETHWKREVKEGRVCALDPDEWQTIRIFLDWLLRRYHVRLR